MCFFPLLTSMEQCKSGTKTVPLWKGELFCKKDWKRLLRRTVLENSASLECGTISFLNMTYKERNRLHPLRPSKVAPFFKTAPLRSRFSSTFFLSVTLHYHCTLAIWTSFLTAVCRILACNLVAVTLISLSCFCIERRTKNETR